jgi:hypothetical protein
MVWGISEGRVVRWSAGSVGLMRCEVLSAMLGDFYNVWS